MEFDLLVHLAREPERVFTKDELLCAVWRYGSGGSTRTLDSHASRLRRKLAPDAARCWIVNVWGIGYRLMLSGLSVPRAPAHTLDGLQQPARQHPTPRWRAPRPAIGV